MFVCLFVSIRSRRCRREILAAAALTAGTSCGFNPLPPLPAGDTTGVHHAGYVYPVSIRSRRCRREIRKAGRRKAANMSFNPLPPLPAGDTRPPMGKASLVGEFQSAPAVAGGRYNLSEAARMAGYAVSIRSRRCRREIRRGAAIARVAFQFQSAPAVAGGRYHADVDCYINSCSFNPLPPLPAGDTSREIPLTPHLAGFNPLPPLPAGDTLPHAADRHHRRRFNPLPPLPAGDTS